MNVLLLRQEEESDKYHARFQTSSSVGMVTSLPVLSFEFYNIDKVREFVKHIDKYRGLIFTSRRAITAFKDTVSESELVKMQSMKDFVVYVVGRSSAEDCARQLGLTSRGAETGNAKELSNLIIKEEQNATKPLMFLCGNLARETIPTRLSDNSIPNESISCYRTIADIDFIGKFERYIIDHKTPDAIAFFSPSGAEFYLKEIKALLGARFEKVKLLCIGDYTKEAVVKLGETVHGTALKPTPDGLLVALEGAIEKN